MSKSVLSSPTSSRGFDEASDDSSLLDRSGTQRQSVQRAFSRCVDVEERVAAAIQFRVPGAVRNLTVDAFGDEVVVSGVASSFYIKQSATHAALFALEGRMQLTNAIKVIACR